MSNPSTLRAALGLASASFIGLLASCSPYQQQGAAIGGLGGAALGAIAGDDGGDVVRGAAIGAAAGTGVAAYRENQSSRNNSYNSTRSTGSTYQTPRQATNPPARIPSRPPVQTQTKPKRTDYPEALAGVTPNTVISPYPPYNPLDVTGYSSGQKVCDPSTIPIDPATGRQFIDPSTNQPDVRRGKYFIVP